MYQIVSVGNKMVIMIFEMHGIFNKECQTDFMTIRGCGSVIVNLYSQQL